MGDKITLTFSKEKETKNAVRYEEELAEGRDRGVVGNIYILKRDLEGIGNPSKVSVTIESAG